MIRTPKVKITPTQVDELAQLEGTCVVIYVADEDGNINTALSKSQGLVFAQGEFYIAQHDYEHYFPEAPEIFNIGDRVHFYNHDRGYADFGVVEEVEPDMIYVRTDIGSHRYIRPNELTRIPIKRTDTSD